MSTQGSRRRNAAGLNDRQRRFCENLASGRSAKGAYIEAGYSAKCAGTAAARLKARPEIAAYLATLRDQTANAAALGRRELLRILERVMELGVDKGTLPPVVSAAALYARICGFEDVAAGEAPEIPTQVEVRFVEARHAATSA